MTDTPVPAGAVLVAHVQAALAALQGDTIIGFLNARREGRNSFVATLAADLQQQGVPVGLQCVTATAGEPGPRQAFVAEFWFLTVGPAWVGFDVSPSGPIRPASGPLGPPRAAVERLWAEYTLDQPLASLKVERVDAAPRRHAFAGVAMAPLVERIAAAWRQACLDVALPAVSITRGPRL